MGGHFGGVVLLTWFGVDEESSRCLRWLDPGLRVGGTKIEGLQVD